MKRQIANPFAGDKRSTKKLFQIAVSEFENEKASNAISVLQWRATREVFEMARGLCCGPRVKEREVGIYVLAQIGVSKPVFIQESVSLLIDRLQDRSTHVIHAAAVGLGHRGEEDGRAIPYLVALKDHPSAYVRYGVAFALMTYERPQAIRVLIELTRDKDFFVRDWATFGLGELIGQNTRPIRDALFARLKERDAVICRQCLIGLAVRKDSRVLLALEKELARRFHGTMSTEVSELVFDRRLYPALVKLQERWASPPKHRYSGWLDEIVEACKPKKKRKTKR